ncbi:MAG TPA: hypothetical protein VFE53_26050 [Mucilaginibacter sp.]|jgi:hypothetical protein|nr:hypothetical protein [Mucilaginibacter sp.]
MNTIITPVQKCRRALFLFAILFGVAQCFAQKPADTKLDKMPVALETDYALSSLPPQLRSGATVYLLDPAKGYYIARKGSNGFICFVMRTAWEWAEFRNDVITAISYDAEGARVIFPVYQDAAAMRASGKYSALQVRDIIIERIEKGVYKAPARAGLSYMLAPVMRTYPAKPDKHDVMTMEMPHYMFYAPYLTNADIGNIPDGQADGPVLVNPEAMFLGKNKAPYGYIIVLAGEKERAKIVADNKVLLKRLGDYRSYMKI